MTETKPGFLAQVKSYPETFWVANTMEIFERMAWYGFFFVSTLYITGSVETGGLGFSAEQRGQIQGIATFLLYLLPVLTGALADRYGYKKTLLLSFVMMAVAYYSLGQFFTFPTFLCAFLFVAIGAAIFKPVVVGTVARVTNRSNSAMGFGIFYMMVNVGAFIGPIIAGVVRGMDWNYVFISCSGWIVLNIIVVVFFFKEPTTEAASGKGRSLGQVLDNTVEVLGNLRFFITVFGVLIALMVANQGPSWFGWWPHCALFVPAWIALNLAWDRLLPRETVETGVPQKNGRSPFLKRMHCSNWRFALYLLILSGFWTSYNQLFMTMPEYLRDFVDTKPLIASAEALFGKSDPDDPESGVAPKIATINEKERAEMVKEVKKLFDARESGRFDTKALESGSLALLKSKVRVTPEKLEQLVTAGGAVPEKVTDTAIIQGRQVNPEFITNIVAGAIVLLQVLVSYLMARFHRFTTMIIGMLVAAAGYGMAALAGGEGMLGAGAMIWMVVAGLFIFAIGEMMTSPTSQEYVGLIAPKDKVALYMGYYFVAVSLGNLFGGILSGQLYGKLARDAGRPDLMWTVFAGMMLVTAVLFVLYNRFVISGNTAEE